MKVIKIEPFGYCEGVKNALNRINDIIKNSDSKKVLFGDIIHNSSIHNELLKKIDIIEHNEEKFNDFLNQNNNYDVILSAHGTYTSTYNELNNKKIKFSDLTCKYVKKINDIIAKNSNRKIYYIGIKDHPECNASLSYSKNIDLIDINDISECKKIENNSLIINQSTIPQEIIADILNKYNCEDVEVINCTCPFVEARIKSLISVINDKDLFIIVGDKSSNNSKMLLKIYYKYTNSHNCIFMLDNLNDFDKKVLSSYERCFICSGTSASNEQVNKIAKYLESI